MGEPLWGRILAAGYPSEVGKGALEMGVGGREVVSWVKRMSEVGRSGERGGSWMSG